MASVMERLQADYREAMRARNEAAVSTYRMLFARVKNTEIEQRVPHLSDDDLQAVLAKEVKQREAALEDLRRANRPEIVAREEEQLAVLKPYLPAALSEEDVRTVVRDAIARTGAAGKSAMGAVMKEAMAELRGRADGKVINRIVGEELSRTP